MKIFKRRWTMKMKEKKESFYKLKMSLEDKIKLMYKTFEGTYLVSNRPHSPSLPLRTCSSDRGRVRRSLSRRSSRSRTRRSLQVRMPS